jgi:hypothetical protein
MTSTAPGATTEARDLSFSTPRVAATSLSTKCGGDPYASRLTDNSPLSCRDLLTTVVQRSRPLLSKRRGQAEMYNPMDEGAILPMSVEEMDDACLLIDDPQTCLPDLWVSGDEDRTPSME